ncbi:MAG TPA: peptidoglycan-binding protein [Gaiellaceae bacterium]|nr:peptidoglycan-binding protein [Gaiellaceae bacterium]
MNAAVVKKRSLVPSRCSVRSRRPVRVSCEEVRLSGCADHWCVTFRHVVTKNKWFWPAVIVGGLVVLAIVLAVVLTQDNGSSSNSTGTTSTTSTVASDPAVVDLQKVMTRLGYYSGPIDGVYGSATTAAVTEMQKALGVTADGVYGPATDTALKGKGKDTVVQIQTELAKYGYYTGPIDGHYGEGTKAAVMKLQTDLGVTPDGQVGQETLAAFEKAVADGTLTPVDSTTTTTTTTTTSTTTSTTSTTPTTTP